MFNAKPHREYPDPRGIPVVQRGSSSAMPGSDPLSALIAKENRGKLHLRAPEPLERPKPTTSHVRSRKGLGRRVRPQGRHF